MTHGHVSVVSADHDLFAGCDDISFFIYPRIDYGFRTAGAYGFDFRYRVGNLEKPSATGEEMRQKICSQTEAENGNITEIHYFAQFIYLLRREKLTLVGDDDIDMAHFAEKGEDAFLGRYDIRLFREPYP